MSRLNGEWKVQAHGPLEEIDDDLWSVAGEITMPLGHFPRRMTVVRLAGRRLAIWSGIPLREPAMQQLESLGAISYLIVPGATHRLDIRAWKHRYPSALVVCAPGASKAVAEAVPVDATGDVLADPQVQLETVAGTDGKECALIARRDSGATLVINDLIANVRHPHGLGANLMARLMGFGIKGPQMPRVAAKLFVKDRAALAQAFDAWAGLPQLRRIVVSHGDVIGDQVRSTLQRLSAELRSADRAAA